MWYSRQLGETTLRNVGEMTFAGLVLYIILGNAYVSSYIWMKCHFLGEGYPGVPGLLRCFIWAWPLVMGVQTWMWSLAARLCHPPPTLHLQASHSSDIRIPACLEPHTLWWRASGNLFPSCLMSVVPEELSPWYPGWHWTVSPSLLCVVFHVLRTVLNG